MSKTGAPKGFDYKPIYEPDQKRMVKALKVIAEYTPKSKSDTFEISKDTEKTG